jgi:quercetin dioxygenase-like cupin family protein
MKFILEPHHEKIIKPWGYEILYTPENLNYTGKVLVVHTGKRSSMHYHETKKETLCLFSGNVLLWMENDNGEIEKISMEPFKGYTVQPGQKHRYEAIEDSFMLEASMPETGTTVRLEDDAGRPNETEDIRKEQNRGWQG